VATGAEVAQVAAVGTIFEADGMSAGRSAGRAIQNFRIQSQFGILGFGIRRLRERFGPGFDFDGRALGLEFLEAVQTAMEGAFSGVDAALEVKGFLAGIAEDVAEVSGRIEIGFDTHLVHSLSFQGAEAAEQDDGMNDAVESIALPGGNGLMMAIVFGAEQFDGGGIFAG
jgi:hypothetical protein